MWTWDDFTAALGHILDDADATAHPDALRLEGLNAALRAMLPYRPWQSKATYTDVSEFSLPADCYRPIMATALDGAGNVQHLSETSPGESNGFWLWGNTVYLDETFDAVTLYYQAVYPELALDAADIPVPVWAREAVLYRAAAHCLVPNQVSRARLGAFHDRQDSNPLDNSLIQTADWLIAQFERIMVEHKHAGR